MCSSRYCSSFAPLFFFYFLGCRCFFWEISTFLFYFFDIFPLLRSTKAVTTENMSSNKCKTWPVEFSENWMKIDKNLVTTKRGSCDHFLANLKIPNLDKAGMDGSKIFFWSICIYGTSKTEFVCENWTSFKNWLRIRGQNGNNVCKIGHNSQDLMETMGENTRTGL